MSYGNLRSEFVNFKEATEAMYTALHGRTWLESQRTVEPRRKMEPITFPCRCHAQSPDQVVLAPARCAIALGGFAQGR